MRLILNTFCCVIAITLASATAQAQLTIGDVAGFDFESPTPVFPTDGSSAGVGTNAATNFNLYNTQAADGTTVMQSDFVDLAGAPVTGLCLEVTNNLGKDTGLTGVVSNPTVSPFNDTSIYSDSYGAANVGNMDRADFGLLTEESNIVLTFTGLDDELCYNVTGGGGFNSNNFDTVWTAGDVSATTDSTSTTGGAFVTLSDLATDGSGNLTVTVTRANVQLLFSAVTIEAVEKVDDNFELVEQFTACFDFESPTPAFPADGSNAGVGTNAATNFNLYDTQAADGTTVMQTGFVDLTGAPITGLCLEVTNNLGKDTGLTGVVSNMTTVEPFNDTSIYSDNYGAATVGNMDRPDFGPLTDESNIVLTFTGLDDELCYNVTGGGAFNNNNFDTIWTAGDVSATTDSTSETGGEFVTLSNLATDGSGNLAVTVRRANVQILFSAVCITAFEKVETNFELGDVNQDGMVDFLDITPFIAVVTGGGFQFEADTNGDGEVDFLDIVPFINLLTGA